MKKRVWRPLKAESKMACEFHKIACAIHRILFADWALEGKNAQVTTRVIILIGSWSETKTEPNEQRSDRKGQYDDNNRFALLLGAEKQKVAF